MGDERQAEQRMPGDVLDVIARAVFRSGMSREVVDAKWPGIRRALRNFEPETVADLSPSEIDGIVADPEVIRNRRKIEAIVSNARTLLGITDQHGSFDAYLATFSDFESRSKALRRDFKYVGEFGAYFVLYVMGDDVPPPKEHWKRSI